MHSIHSGIKFVIAALICFSILELYTRGTEISNVSFTGYDEELGWRMFIPYSKIALYNENFTFRTVNKYSYLGPSYPPQKDSSVLRIALIGDSYVEGFHLMDRHHFRFLLERMLKEKLNRYKVEVLNFGRSGFGINDMYAYDVNYVSKFNPDLKIYFASEKDFHVNTQDRLVPRWKLKNGELEIDTTFKNSNYLKRYKIFQVGLQNSALLQLTRNAIDLISKGEAVEILFDKFAPLLLDTKKNMTKPSYTAENLSNTTTKILSNLGNQNDVILVNSSEYKYSKGLRDMLSNYDINYLSLEPLLVKIMAEDEIDPFYWSVTGRRGHWNYLAHQRIGFYLGEYLTNNIDRYIKIDSN